MTNKFYPQKEEQFILRPAGLGHSFHCDNIVLPGLTCGCNVFHKVGPRDGKDRYGCNCCPAVYIVEE